MLGFKLKKNQIKNRRYIAILCILSLLVSTSVFLELRLTGIALEKEAAAELTHDARTISVSKNWRGDTMKDRPESVTFELYTDDAEEPIDTLTLTAENATIAGGNTWTAEFQGKYPIFDEEGNEINYFVKEAEIEGYRCVQNGVDSVTNEGYQNVSVYVPVTEIKNGEDYLVSNGLEGDVRLYRAESTITDEIVYTEDGMVKAVKDGRIIEEDCGDGTYNAYTGYILASDEKVNGENPTDYMTWRAVKGSDGSAVLLSNCYRLWGEKEENNPDKWEGYLSTEKNKKEGLCVYKKVITDVNAAPDFTRFRYDEATEGFKTSYSDKVVYLYKKIQIRDGTFRSASTKISFTNWKNASQEDEPLEPGEKDPEPFTNVHLKKEWTDGAENHTEDMVTVVLNANGSPLKEIVIGAKDEWKAVFEGLPTEDSDGNIIEYTISEKSAVDGEGNALEYLPEYEVDETEGSVWLPVDRPSKKAGGEEYIVIAFPNDKKEIGQDIWEDGDQDGEAHRIALTSNPSGTKYALGKKNSGNAGGASLDVTVTEGPLNVNGKTYTNYIKDSEAHNPDGTDRNTIIWEVEYRGQGKNSQLGPWPRDVFTFKALAGAGGYLKADGSQNLDKNYKEGDNSETLFAYGMICNEAWKQFESMIKQGYTEDQITHMVGCMNHYAIRSDKAPGDFGQTDCTYPAFYLYKKITVINKQYTLTNRPDEKIDVNVKKVWDDENNKDQCRPAYVKIELFKNGHPTGQYRYLDESNGWQYTFTDLKKTDQEGKDIRYTVKEYVSNKDMYDAEYDVQTDAEGNISIEICNKKKETIEIPVEKIWVDGNDKHTTGTITVTLLADGEPYKGDGGTATFGADENWSYTFKNLLKYQEDGVTEIIYTIEEADVPGYTGEITGDAENGYQIKNTAKGLVIPMPETGSTSRMLLENITIGLLLAGMLLIIKLKIVGRNE